MEVTIPIYIIGSLSSFIVWSSAIYFYKRCTENENRNKSILAQYDVEKEPFMNSYEPLV